MTNATQSFATHSAIEFGHADVAHGTADTILVFPRLVFVAVGHFRLAGIAQARLDVRLERHATQRCKVFAGERFGGECGARGGDNGLGCATFDTRCVEAQQRKHITARLLLHQLFALQVCQRDTKLNECRVTYTSDNIHTFS